MEIKYLSIDFLTPYPHNARVHSEEQILQIASSIKEFGFTNPVLIDKENGIVAGHGRVLAARVLGMNEVPTICIEFMSDAQRRAYILADNKIALNSGWDDELLKLELGQLNGEGMELNLIGFSSEELEKILNSKEKEFLEQGYENDGGVGQESVCQTGDTWILGNHKLICGEGINLYDCDATIGQWQEYTGQDAIHKGTGKTFDTLCE